MYDLIIIGAGPAGITAGIYAKRANLKVAVFENGAPGGQMVSTGEVENYPGFSKKAGIELGMELFNHGLSLGVEYIFDNVIKINDGHTKEVITPNKKYQTKTILIATGAKPRKLGLKHEDRLSGRGVSWCAICDGSVYKDKKVIVVGGGNSAVEEASYLATLATHVTIVQNLDSLTADSKAIDILLAKDNVDIIYESTVQSFIVDEKMKLKGANIKDNEGNIIKIDADGVFEYIGLIPSTDQFKNLKILNDFGYIPTDQYMQTSLKGIYAAGDVREKQIRQVVTATNDGAIAVQNILKHLETW